MDDKNQTGLFSFPDYRPRRMRSSEGLRRLIRETRFSLDQLIMPYFVREGRNLKEPISAMPDQFRFSQDTLMRELETLHELGVRSLLLFGLPEEKEKDERGSAAWSADGIIQRTVRQIKKQFPDFTVITDVCLCAYTSHGHCGLINAQGMIDNDASLECIAQTALSHAEAGADIVAPSDMMDGRVKAIREKLDQKNFSNTAILSYAVKYASAFYGPFREAAHSAPAVCDHIPRDRKSYQMDPSNMQEALREALLDIQEGADMIMVKPGGPYLDVIRETANTFHFPVAAYAVSGEYAMIKAAAQNGWLNERDAVMEQMTGFARAGATAVITYHAKQIALWNREQQLPILQAVT